MNLRSILIFVGATLGAGLFSLPRAYNSVGWPVLLVAVLATFVCHRFFLLSLERRSAGDHHHLPGLVGERFGLAFGYVASLSVVGGLVLSVLIYIVLIGGLLGQMVPSVSGGAYLIAWALLSFPVFLPIKRFVGVESFATLLLLMVIPVVAFLAPRATEIYSAGKLLPVIPSLGIMLFAFSGWTSLPAINHLSGGRKMALRSLLLGTILVFIVSLLFSSFLSGTDLGFAEDIFLTTSNWPAYVSALFYVAVFLAVFTSFGPVAEELSATLRRDLNLPAKMSLLLSVISPLVLIYLGMDNFFMVASLAGGVFVALQYIFIAALSWGASRGAWRLGVALSFLLFVVAMVSEMAYFL